VEASCLSHLAASNAFSQDNLFSTVLGMTGTQTREYKPGDDILAACRSKA
jgi:lipid A ethanolaminephosphotransferase